MTTTPSTPSPGLVAQARTRTVLRVVGLLLTLVGVVLMGFAIADFFGAFDRSVDVVDVPGFPGEVEVDDGPELFWMFFVAIPVLFVGLASLSYGFLGATSRYVSGETAPVLKDGAAYLTDGQGLLGVGRTVDDRACGSCGRANDADATFCSGCGTRLA